MYNTNLQMAMGALGGAQAPQGGGAQASFAGHAQTGMIPPSPGGGILGTIQGVLGPSFTADSLHNVMGALQGQYGGQSAFHDQMRDWRSQRPTQGGMDGGGPVMTPGGGGTGAPLQGPPALPSPQVGMVPGVPGSMGLNPGGPVQGLPVNPGTGLAPGQMPLNPGVGTGLGVMGATPANGPYGLPTY